MTKQYTIFIDERPLILSDSIHGISPEFLNAPLFTKPDRPQVTSCIHDLQTGKFAATVLIDPNVDGLLETVKSHYTVLTAGGGLIVNTDGDVLLMFRRGKWDLPKGKLDPGETIEQCAIREVAEETGLLSITLEHKITETYHYYAHKDQPLLKHTVWFHMRFTGTELTIPQIEEDIMDIQWIKPENVGKYMQYSYQNIRAVFAADGFAV
ncbi:NUDIX hydrolase [Chitinophaga parva]|uniref:NUDIX hydrolase n=1 Tax=Chitinophaga parva TaxID=2169414 RepID=A0A2T7BBH8_9BACT|nr:NUDIX domain-containing protein [Chitinophaga parva]PUZ21733.1 NUDIX hydrolase [Chitinophaga parva]